MIVAAIPAYNEEAYIAKVIVKAKKHVEMVIVCDEGSKDATGEIATALGAEVQRNERNSGKGAALRNLFLAASRLNPEVLVTIDADGQHNPDEIPVLVAAVRKGADVVIGSRFIGDIPRVRGLGNSVLSSVAMAGIRDTQSGFRAYNGARISELVPTEMGMGADTEILKKARDAGMKIEEVPISVSYQGNTPTHNPVYHGLDVLLSTVKQISIRHPLVFYGIPGFVSLLISAFFWWWTFTSFAEHRTIVTNVAIVAGATAVVGLIMLAIAIILWVLISVVRESRP